MYQIKYLLIHVYEVIFNIHAYTIIHICHILLSSKKPMYLHPAKLLISPPPRRVSSNKAKESHKDIYSVHSFVLRGIDPRLHVAQDI